MNTRNKKIVALNVDLQPSSLPLQFQIVALYFSIDTKISNLFSIQTGYQTDHVNYKIISGKQF